MYFYLINISFLPNLWTSLPIFLHTVKDFVIAHLWLSIPWCWLAFTIKIHPMNLFLQMKCRFWNNPLKARNLVYGFSWLNLLNWYMIHKKGQPYVWCEFANNDLISVVWVTIIYCPSLHVKIWQHVVWSSSQWNHRTYELTVWSN